MRALPLHSETRLVFQKPSIAEGFFIIWRFKNLFNDNSILNFFGISFLLHEHNRTCELCTRLYQGHNPEGRLTKRKHGLKPVL